MGAAKLIVNNPAAGGDNFAGFITEVIHDVEITPTNALAGYRLNLDGTIQRAQQSGTNNYLGSDSWIIPRANASLYKVKATIISGTLTTGTSGSFLGLEATQTWEKVRTSDVAGVDECVFTLEIQRKSDSVSMKTVTITLQADVQDLS